MQTDAMKRAKARYDAENAVQFRLRLHRIYDGQVLERLEEASACEGGKQGYIKGLIREDIARNK